MTSMYARGVAVGALLCAAGVVATYGQDVPKGAVLMAAGRQALGGDGRLAAVKTLQVTGTFRRVIASNDIDGDFEIFLELPDKYLRSEKTGTPGQPSTETIEALVGSDVRDAVRGGGGRGGRGGGGGGGDAAGAVDGLAGGDSPPPADSGIDRGDNPGGAALGPADGPGGAQGAAESTATEPARGRGGSGVDLDTQRRVRQAEVGRLLMMWLLRSETPVTWIGIAESPDGKADVLEASFAGESTRLFLDAASHMPLMMTWQGVQGPAGGPGGRRGFGGARGRGPGQGPPDGVVPDAGAARGGPPQPMAFEMTFADHRIINGVRLPHIVTRGINGQTVEQWTIRSYRVNPSFNANTFIR